MRAYMVPEFGALGSIGERAVPAPAEGEILVRVRAAAVNAFDVVLTTGALRTFLEHRLPLTPGLEYAGTVEVLGPGVEGPAVGSEVFGAVGKGYFGEGSFADHVTAVAAVAAERPAELPAEQAAAVTQAASTAIAEVDAAGVSPGDTVLVVGAAGGVGNFTTQLAARRGARVICVTRAANADFVRSLGAAEVIDRDADDLDAAVRRLAPDGVAALIDNFHDAQGLVPLAALVRAGGHVVTPIAMGAAEALAGQAVIVHHVRAAVERAGELGAMVARGELVVPVETMPLELAGEAIERVASKSVRGKLVLVVG